MSEPAISTFWDEKNQRSELRFLGHTLYGANDATLAILMEIDRLRSELCRLYGLINDASRAMWVISDRALGEGRRRDWDPEVLP